MSNQDDAFHKAYGERLRLTRAVLGITEQEAAEAHGVTLKTYRRWEAGERSHGQTGPTIRFATKYDVSLDWLIAGEPAELGPHRIKVPREALKGRLRSPLLFRLSSDRKKPVVRSVGTNNGGISR